MPRFSAAPTSSERRISYSLTDFTGKPRAGRIIITSGTTTTEINNAVGAIGDMSNARLMSTNLATVVEQLNPGNVLNTAFDEAHATVDIAAVLIFQNNAGVVQYVEVPAPDAQCFESDGETIDADNALVSAAITAILAAANNGGGTYAFLRGYRTTRAARAGRNRTPLTIAEPGEGDLPGAEPAPEPEA